jgi:hypothetical protein
MMESCQKRKYPTGIMAALSSAVRKSLKRSVTGAFGTRTPSTPRNKPSRHKVDILGLVFLSASGLREPLCVFVALGRILSPGYEQIDISTNVTTYLVQTASLRDPSCARNWPLKAFSFPFAFLDTSTEL